MQACGSISILVGDSHLLKAAYHGSRANFEVVLGTITNTYL